ncbi:MAG: cytochrome b6-f complex iron-sulfur subunit [Actinomycetota bacterium]|nr:cytochrome b6-f complex iron-sulfur subunit [Actinomycetota bacterium]
MSSADGLDRRSVLQVACGSCAALALSACGGGSSSSGTGGASTTAPDSGGSSPTAAAAAGATAIAQLADIPVGSSISAKSGDKPLLIARPTATTVVAFSAICTHQGCTVAPAGKTFACPCHGSKYDAFTGAVINGPAPAPLHPFAVAVKDGAVVPA